MICVSQDWLLGHTSNKRCLGQMLPKLNLSYLRPKDSDNEGGTYSSDEDEFASIEDEPAPVEDPACRPLLRMLWGSLLKRLSIILSSPSPSPRILTSLICTFAFFCFFFTGNNLLAMGFSNEIKFFVILQCLC